MGFSFAYRAVRGSPVQLPVLPYLLFFLSAHLTVVYAMFVFAELQRVAQLEYMSWMPVATAPDGFKRYFVLATVFVFVFDFHCDSGMHDFIFICC